MRQVLVLFLILFFSSTASGQSFQRLKSLLHKQDFKAFKTFVDGVNPTNPKGDTIADWNLVRTIISGYTEVMIDINAVDSHSTVKEYYVYRLNVLVSGSRIIFYDLQKKKIHRQSPMTFETVELLKDENGYQDFELDFKKNYGIDLDENDLFLSSFTYGQHCGIGGQNPNLLRNLNVLIKNRNIDKINKWLKSANAETQLYAVRGYTYLKTQGYKLSEEEERLIKLIGQKEGEVSVCSGCSFFTDDFKSVMAEILSSSAENLEPEEDWRDMADSRFDMYSTPEQQYPFLITLGMTALFFICVINFIKFARLRKKWKEDRR